MGTTLFPSCCFSFRQVHKDQIYVRRLRHEKVGERGGFYAAPKRGCGPKEEEDGEEPAEFLGRRCALVSGLSLASGMVLGFPREGLAVKQGLLAGRIPGLSDPDEKDRLEDIQETR